MTMTPNNGATDPAFDPMNNPKPSTPDFEAPPAPSPDSLWGGDAMQMFTALLQMGKNVLMNADYAYRTNRILANQMLRDPYVMQPLQRRMLAPISLDWEIVPEKEGDPSQKQMADVVTSILKDSKRFVDGLRALQWGVFRGLGATELYWHYDRSKSRWGIAGYRLVNGDKIQFDRWGWYYMLTIRDQWAGRRMTVQEMTRLVLHRYEPDDGEFYMGVQADYMYRGRGCRDGSFPYWLLKTGVIKLWTAFLERFGIGFPIGRYEQGNSVQMNAMQQFLQSMNRDAMALLPIPPGGDNPPGEGKFGVDFVKMPGISESSGVFDRFIQWADSGIRIYIQGEEQANQKGGDGMGSGLADARKENATIYTDYDRAILEETVTREIVNRITFFNWGMNKPGLKFRMVDKSRDEEIEVKKAQLAQQWKIPVTKKWLYEVCGAPMPQDGEEVYDWSQVDPMPENPSQQEFGGKMDSLFEGGH